MTNVIYGDLIKLAENGEFNVIVHGCNCFHKMGAGIAAQIKKRYPQAYQADLATPYGSQGKLGSFSTAFVATDKTQFVIVNAYTQFRYGTGGPHLDYGALRACFAGIKRTFQGKRIGYPLIGAGLGGGDWARVQVIINEQLKGEQHFCVQLPS